MPVASWSRSSEFRTTSSRKRASWRSKQPRPRTERRAQMMRRRGMGVVGTAVVVGGAAHYGAKRANQQADAQDQAQQAAYDQGVAAGEQPAAAPPAPSSPAEDDAAEIQK